MIILVSGRTEELEVEICYLPKYWWRIGRFPDMKKTDLIEKYESVTEKNIGKIPFDKSRAREPTYKELGDVKQGKYGKEFVEWIGIDELSEMKRMYGGE